MRTKQPRTESEPVCLVVMDFDDTLYDWIGHFMPALDAMIHTAAPLLDITEDELRKQLKAVHEHYGNTEQPFALLETTAAQQRFGNLPRAQQRRALAGAFAAFDEVRATRLRLYDDVEPAFTKLQQEGIPIVGYSAAPSVNIAKRVALLGLAQYFTCIYASPFIGKEFPGSRPVHNQDISILEMERSKPDPGAVRRITGDLKVPPANTLFVGDSVASDIAPAVMGGAQAALVKRQLHSAEAWMPGLLEVSHRAAETRADSVTLSDARLARVPVIDSLVGLWDHFVFHQPVFAAL